MRIDRYDTIITVVDREVEKMLALKFKLEYGKLYAYNFYLPNENRKMVEISKINGVNISTIINKVTVDDLYDVNKLKSFGIDTSTQFVFTVVDGNKEGNIDIFNPESDISIFYKKHEINSTIPAECKDITLTTNISNNIMLDYASTNVKGLLNILNNLLISNSDKTLINEVIGNIDILSENYNNDDNNLDMIFLSSLLLMLDDKLNLIPKHIENLMRRVLHFDFGEDNLEQANNSILSNSEIDYKKIIKMIRNCIAHSNYKVLKMVI